MAVVTLPWTKQRWALPFLCVLATTPEVSEQLGKQHKTVGMWTHQMMSLVRRWLPDRSFKLLGDTPYSVLELSLHANDQQIILISTGRLHAVLHEPPPERIPHTIGRPRVVGQRLPSLKQVLQNPETVWQKLTLEWYGQGKRTLEFCAGTALWDRSGSAPLPLRSRLDSRSSGQASHHAPFFPLTLPRPQNISSRMRMKRWSLEVTFEEGRAQ